MVDNSKTVLVVEDSKTTMAIFKKLLTRWDYRVLSAYDGNEAWDIIQEERPKLILLDWLIPGIDGVTICRRLRESDYQGSVYVIMVTAMDKKEAIVFGLGSGADDYMTKPFEAEELEARIKVGWRVLELEMELRNKVVELEERIKQVKQLSGLLPICSYCKKIRNDKEFWNSVEDYLEQHADVKFSHGVCPECYEKHVIPQLEELKKQTVLNK